MPHEPEPTDPTQQRLTPAQATGCGWFAVGFIVSGVLGMGLAFWVVQQNGPGWLIPLAFFGPPVAFFLIFGSVAVPRLLRMAREAARNAPSPESAAAAAAGEGVEAGTKAEADGDAEKDEFPTVVVADTEPGKVLAHRLARAGLAPGCTFGCSVGVAVFWNGIVSVFVYQIFDNWNRGQGVQWFEALFLVPFVVVGVVLIFAAFFAGLKWIVSGLVGRVDVEVSVHPLTPGGAVQVHVGQNGLFRIARVELSLVCTEEATYVAGTSKSTAKKEVVSHPISDADANPEGSTLPLSAAFTVPGDAMHSFDAPNNEINWTVRVKGRVLGLLPFGDDYSLTVVPG